VNRRGALRLFGGGSLAALAVCHAPLAFAQAVPLYRNAQAPIPARVADLMARMTLPEKIAQIRTAWARKSDMIDGLAFSAAKASAAFPDGIGHVTRPFDKRGVPGIAGAAGGTAARWRTPRETVGRVTLNPGERKTASFTLGDRHLAIWNRDMREVVEPEPVIVSAGSSSASLNHAEFATV
jgi:hypothetical protein